jgi:hypothetical protein
MQLVSIKVIRDFIGDFNQGQHRQESRDNHQHHMDQHKNHMDTHHNNMNNI